MEAGEISPDQLPFRWRCLQCASMPGGGLECQSFNWNRIPTALAKASRCDCEHSYLSHEPRSQTGLTVSTPTFSAGGSRPLIPTAPASQASVGSGPVPPPPSQPASLPTPAPERTSTPGQPPSRAEVASAAVNHAFGRDTLGPPIINTAVRNAIDLARPPPSLHRLPPPASAPADPRAEANANRLAAFSPPASPWSAPSTIYGFEDPALSGQQAVGGSGSRRGRGRGLRGSSTRGRGRALGSQGTSWGRKVRPFAGDIFFLGVSDRQPLLIRSGESLTLIRHYPGPVGQVQSSPEASERSYAHASLHFNGNESSTEVIYKICCAIPAMRDYARACGIELYDTDEQVASQLWTIFHFMKRNGHHKDFLLSPDETRYILNGPIDAPAIRHELLRTGVTNMFMGLCVLDRATAFVLPPNPLHWVLDLYGCGWCRGGLATDHFRARGAEILAYLLSDDDETSSADGAHVNGLPGPSTNYIEEERQPRSSVESVGSLGGKTKHPRQKTPRLDDPGQSPAPGAGGRKWSIDSATLPEPSPSGFQQWAMRGRLSTSSHSAYMGTGPATASGSSLAPPPGHSLPAAPPTISPTMTTHSAGVARQVDPRRTGVSEMFNATPPQAEHSGMVMSGNTNELWSFEVTPDLLDEFLATDGRVSPGATTAGAIRPPAPPSAYLTRGMGPAPVTPHTTAYTSPALHQQQEGGPQPAPASTSTSQPEESHPPYRPSAQGSSVGVEAHGASGLTEISSLGSTTSAMPSTTTAASVPSAASAIPVGPAAVPANGLAPPGIARSEEVPKLVTVRPQPAALSSNQLRTIGRKWHNALPNNLYQHSRYVSKITDSPLVIPDIEEPTWTLTGRPGPAANMFRGLLSKCDVPWLLSDTSIRWYADQQPDTVASVGDGVKRDLLNRIVDSIIDANTGLFEVQSRPAVLAKGIRPEVAASPAAMERLNKDIDLLVRCFIAGACWFTSPMPFPQVHYGTIVKAYHELFEPGDAICSAFSDTRISRAIGNNKNIINLLNLLCQDPDSTWLKARLSMGPDADDGMLANAVAWSGLDEFSGEVVDRLMASGGSARLAVLIADNVVLNDFSSPTDDFGLPMYRMLAGELEKYGFLERPDVTPSRDFRAPVV